jgi:hypothetical protein
VENKEGGVMANLEELTFLASYTATLDLDKGVTLLKKDEEKDRREEEEEEEDEEEEEEEDKEQEEEEEEEWKTK